MTYRLNFLSAWGKLYQSAKHRDVLKGKLGLDVWQEAPIFRDKANRVTMVAKLDPETGEHVVKIAGVPDRLLGELGMEFGDAIHNLRSALDHVAWQLALEHYGGWKPPKPNEVYFPITDTARKFNEHRALPHFDPARVKTLRRFQPYNGEDGRYLGTINRLDITDKHQGLLTFRLNPTEFSKFPGRSLSVSYQTPGSGIHVGTELMRMRFDPTDPKVEAEMESDLVPEVLVPRRRHPVPFLNRATVAVGRCIEALEAQKV